MTTRTLRTVNAPTWSRWCAAILAIALGLVAVHQIAPHHPTQGRCPACPALDRPSLGPATAGIVPTAPTAIGVCVEAVDLPIVLADLPLDPLRGPPLLPIV